MQWCAASVRRPRQASISLPIPVHRCPNSRACTLFGTTASQHISPPPSPLTNNSPGRRPPDHSLLIDLPKHPPLDFAVLLRPSGPPLHSCRFAHGTFPPRAIHHTRAPLCYLRKPPASYHHHDRNTFGPSSVSHTVSRPLQADYIHTLRRNCSFR